MGPLNSIPGSPAPGFYYLTILYMVTPNPLGQTICLTGRTNRVVTGTTTAPHASGRVAKKAPLQVSASRTPAPSLAKTK